MLILHSTFMVTGARTRELVHATHTHRKTHTGTRSHGSKLTRTQVGVWREVTSTTTVVEPATVLPITLF